MTQLSRQSDSRRAYKCSYLLGVAVERPSYSMLYWTLFVVLSQGAVLPLQWQPQASLPNSFTWAELFTHG